MKIETGNKKKVIFIQTLMTDGGKSKTKGARLATKSGLETSYRSLRANSFFFHGKKIKQYIIQYFFRWPKKHYSLESYFHAFA